MDVEVVVSCELLSREVGELSLNFSRGMANSYSSIAKLEVKSGRSEVVLRGRFTPSRTGSLPFAKVHVTLSEFPKRARSVALATDSETVEVK